jgi:hypothetical protein
LSEQRVSDATALHFKPLICEDKFAGNQRICDDPVKVGIVHPGPRQVKIGVLLQGLSIYDMFTIQSLSRLDDMSYVNMGPKRVSSVGGVWSAFRVQRIV